MSKKENKSKKIVLFLSTLKPGILEKKKEKYTAPNGKEYEGLQTNEAPTKYLCDKYQKDIVEILCIVTDEAEEIAWKYFKKSIKKNIPKKKIRKKVKITKIKYDIKQDF